MQIELTERYLSARDGARRSEMERDGARWSEMERDGASSQQSRSHALAPLSTSPSRAVPFLVPARGGAAPMLVPLRTTGWHGRDKEGETQDGPCASEALAEHRVCMRRVGFAPPIFARVVDGEAHLPSPARRRE